MQRGFRIYHVHIKCAIWVDARLRNNRKLPHIGVSDLTRLYLEIRNGYILYVRTKIKHKRRSLVFLPLLTYLQEVSLRQVLHERMLVRVLELLAHLQYRFFVVALHNGGDDSACKIVRGIHNTRP